MTREQKKAILDKAAERAYTAIDATPGDQMNTAGFRILVENVRDMEFQREYLENQDRYPLPDPIPDAPAPEPIETPAPTEVSTGSGDNLMSKEDLRDRLATYSNKYSDLDVAQIMADMGYGKLSDVPNTRYAELLGNVEAAIEGGA